MCCVTVQCSPHCSSHLSFITSRQKLLKGTTSVFICPRQNVYNCHLHSISMLIKLQGNTNFMPPPSLEVQDRLPNKMRKWETVWNFWETVWNFEASQHPKPTSATFSLISGVTISEDAFDLQFPAVPAAPELPELLELAFELVPELFRLIPTVLSTTWNC